MHYPTFILLKQKKMNSNYIRMHVQFKLLFFFLYKMYLSET